MFEYDIMKNKHYLDAVIPMARHIRAILRGKTIANAEAKYILQFLFVFGSPMVEDKLLSSTEVQNIKKRLQAQMQRLRHNTSSSSPKNIASIMNKRWFYG